MLGAIGGILQDVAGIVGAANQPNPAKEQTKQQKQFLDFIQQMAQNNG